jgi:hypothetical protein
VRRFNEASANQALTGILSIVFHFWYRNSVLRQQLLNDYTLTIPATSGILITSGDTGTVTNTMLAGSMQILNCYR